MKSYEHQQNALQSLQLVVEVCHDLHAFRTTLCTHLFRAGVPLRTAQAVMRHSNPALTANIYTDAELLQLDAAVASLPACASGLDSANAQGNS